MAPTWRRHLATGESCGLPPRPTQPGLSADARQAGAVTAGRAPMTALEPTPVANPRIWALSPVASIDVDVDRGGRTLVADHAAGEIGEDRSESCAPRPVRHVPTGRGGSIEGPIPEHPDPDR